MRQALGRIHPAFMGGEYLPDLTPNEVMIARITIASTTQDVTCVYARRGKNRIHYRVVDEYDGETLSERNTRTSTRPLTLGELEAFFNGAWSIFDVLEMNFGRRRLRPGPRCSRFVVGVESQFYPQIGELYRRRIEAWAAARQRRTGLGSGGRRRTRTAISPARSSATRVSRAGTAPDVRRAVPIPKTPPDFDPR